MGQENERNAEAMATRHLDPVYRTHGQVATMEWRGSARTNPERKEQENERNNEATMRHLDHVYRIQDQVGNTAQRRLTREQPGVLENKALGRRDIYDMAT
jgi:hypothetical protein